ncbi:MAG: proprotein convertase P-domain-containing protein [Saprospiraceae bacterium]|nr:proprotein convertase P-domain-containing protein [Saprospiraceae bacterium]
MVFFKTQFFALLFIFTLSSLSAQAPKWSKFSLNNEAQQTIKKDPSWSQISEFQSFEIDFKAFREFALTQIPFENKEGRVASIVLPNYDGTLLNFTLMESPVMESELAAKYPQIKTYKGSSGPYYMRMIITDSWMKAFILGPDGDIIIEQFEKSSPNHFGVYHSNAIKVSPESISQKCGVNDNYIRPSRRPIQLIPASPNENMPEFVGTIPVVLHKYRIALACTGEWGADSQRGGGNVQSALAKMAEVLTYANAVYEKDFAIHMDLVNRNDLIVFLNANTDPYENASIGRSLLGQNTAVINRIITPGFYEFGHIFTHDCSDVGGVASPGSVCSDGGRAAGVTCWRFPDLPYAALRIFCHEVGHQFSADHTFSNCNGNEGASRYEPGSGTTIMSYSGLCGALNIETSGLPHPNFFHSNTIEEVLLFSREFLTCGVKENTGHTYPTAKVLTPTNLTIPIQTPFELKGEGTDMEDQSLTYSWEQFDIGDYGSQLGEVTPNGPLFRVLFPGNSPNRVFPSWNSILSLKNVDVREVLPANTRDLNFRFVVRDNHPGSGGTVYENFKLKATDQAGPFRVTFPNLNSHRLIKNTCNKITWDVANTDRFPINSKKVDIIMYRNRDFDNPIILKENTDNDGSELIDVPDLGTNIRVRIVVKARDHIFFDASDIDVVIIDGTTPSVIMGVTPNLVNLCLPDKLKLDIRSCAFAGFTGDLQLFVENGLPSGASYQFEKNTIGADDASKILIDLNNLTEKTSFTLTIAAVTPAGDTLRDQVQVNVVSNDFSDEILLTPASGTGGATETPLFRWTKSRNADFYHFEVASSPAFGPTVLYRQEFISADSLRLPILLKSNSVYYWRVFPINSCGDGRSSVTYAFQTANKSCVDQAYTGNPVNLFSSRTYNTIMTIPFGGALADMNVNDIDIFVDASNDLSIRLISPKGTRVVLFNNNCGTTLDFVSSFDDDAPIPLTCPPNRGFRMRPIEALSKLNGEDLKGDWKLEIVTRSSLRDGQLRNFTLQYCAELSVSPPVLINNGPLIMDVAERREIKDNLLLVTDPDEGPENLTYTLVNVPSHGSFTLNGVQLTYGSRLTQSDINEGKLVYTHDGSANYYDGFGYTVEDGKGGWLGIETFRILVGPVATQDPKIAESLKAFPNPTSGQLYVQLDAPLSGDGLIQIKDLKGKVVSQKRIKSDKLVMFDLEFLTDGLYLLDYQSSLHRVSKKLILVK